MFKQLNADCLYTVPGLDGAPLDKIRLSVPALLKACYAKVVRFRHRLVEKVYDYLAFPVF
jgi:hypothetical protein